MFFIFLFSCFNFHIFYFVKIILDVIVYLFLYVFVCLVPSFYYGYRCLICFWYVLGLVDCKTSVSLTSHTPGEHKLFGFGVVAPPPPSPKPQPPPSTLVVRIHFTWPKQTDTRGGGAG